MGEAEEEAEEVWLVEEGECGDAAEDEGDDEECEEGADFQEGSGHGTGEGSEPIGRGRARRGRRRRLRNRLDRGRYFRAA